MSESDINEATEKIYSEYLKVEHKKRNSFFKFNKRIIIAVVTMVILLSVSVAFTAFDWLESIMKSLTNFKIGITTVSDSVRIMEKTPEFQNAVCQGVL